MRLIFKDKFYFDMKHINICSDFCCSVKMILTNGYQCKFITIEEEKKQKDMFPSSNKKLIMCRFYFSMSSAWGKRMSSAWGKRDENDNNKLYDDILRELYHRALLSKYDYPRHAIDDDGKNIIPIIDRIFLLHLVFEQYLAQRIRSKSDEEAASQNMS